LSQLDISGQNVTVREKKLYLRMMRNEVVMTFWSGVASSHVR